VLVAYRPISLAILLTAAAVPALAQPQRPPPSVASKMQVMDTACGVAGGKPGNGTYIFPFDFNGDGQTDYLVSEGNYVCVGKPNAFRAEGHAVIEIYVRQGADAPRAFYEVVRGYKIIDSNPRQVQVVRDGSACGPGASGTCTVTLRWDQPTRRFVGGPGPTASGPSGPQVVQGTPVDPLAGVGARRGPPPPPAAEPPPPSAAAGGSPETQAQFVPRCARERMAKYKGLKESIATSSCQEIWKMAQASMPAANGLLAVGGGAPGPMTQAAVRTAITGAGPGVVWGGAVGKGMPASGKIGQWQVQLHGQTLIDNVAYAWAKVGQPIPYDVVEAMKIKGAHLTEVACQNLGGGEGTHVYKVDFAGRPTFGLTVYGREAPTASANSSYSATADLKGPAPTLAALKRTPDGADYQAKCDD
jgi:hypothetical protein